MSLVLFELLLLCEFRVVDRVFDKGQCVVSWLCVARVCLLCVLLDLVCVALCMFCVCFGDFAFVRSVFLFDSYA